MIERPCLRYLMLFGLLIGVVSANVRVASAQGTSIVAPWTAQDIGSPAIAGSSSFDQSTGAFSIQSAGVDIWGTADQFHFVYQAIKGDVVVTARVDDVAFAHAWSKAGVMIRSSLSPSAAQGFVLVSAGRGTAFQRRLADGGSSVSTSGPGAVPPYWVRLARSGTTITASVSADGATWTTIGATDIALGATAYVGLAVTSHNASQATQASVSSVKVTPVGSLPAPQQDGDIGSPAIAGSAVYDQGAYTVRAAGNDIWNSADQFHYVYQPVTGDLDVRVRLSSLTLVDPWSKGGVMIRESLTAGSAHAFAGMASQKGYFFQRRPTTGGSSIHTSGGTGAAPGWIRLKRTGSLITAYRSADGTNWTVVGSDSFTMVDTVYVGIAVTSHNVNTATTAVLDNLAIGLSQPANQPPTATLTSPANGATFTAPASISLTANAADADGTVVRVDFYNGTTLLGSDTTAPYAWTWTNVAAGTYSLRATAVDNAGAATSSSTATVTVSAAGNSAPTATLTSPANGATFTAPASISLTANAADADGTVVRVDFYNGTTLLGSDTTAPYAWTWTNVAAGTYSLRATAVDNAGAATSSSTATITVSAAANSAPTATLTSPANGATFTAPASLSLTANAADADGTVVRVDFYNGTTLLGSDATAPYAITWSNVAAGSYSLRATAVDNAGAATSSSTATVTVSGAATSAPTAVAFQASTDHATGVISYILEIFANGANPNTATPVASSDLGKPSPDAGGGITVDRAAFFSSLAPGSYQAAVSSIGTAGNSRSLAVAFTR